MAILESDREFFAMLKAVRAQGDEEQMREWLEELEKIIAAPSTGRRRKDIAKSRYNDINESLRTSEPKITKKGSGKRNIGYIRVSTIDQHGDRQLADMNLDKTYKDHASGKDTNRPELQKMMSDIESGLIREGDTIIIHSMDRLARNLDDLRKTVSRIIAHGIAVQFVKEAHTFTGEDNPIAQLMLNLMGSFAEFERSLIKERQREGIAAAKARPDSPYKGRKKALSPAQAREMVARIKAGEKKAAIAREYKITRETVYQYLNRG